MEEAPIGLTEILIPPLGLPGSLALPSGPSGCVLFAHGSGSSRLSPRNRQVARALEQRGLGTLLFDLLTEAEAEDRRNVFDIPLLAKRLVAATHWLRSLPELEAAKFGYFGASTGGGAALLAAADPKADVAAIVSRGGRPDLAMEFLPNVRAPTLLIVGARDPQVLELNRAALAALTCEKQLAIVPGATHLFEEPGTLEDVIALAADWFLRYL